MKPVFFFMLLFLLHGCHVPETPIAIASPSPMALTMNVSEKVQETFLLPTTPSPSPTLEGTKTLEPIQTLTWTHEGYFLYASPLTDVSPVEVSGGSPTLEQLHALYQDIKKESVDQSFNTLSQLLREKLKEGKHHEYKNTHTFMISTLNNTLSYEELYQFALHHDFIIPTFTASKETERTLEGVATENKSHRDALARALWNAYLAYYCHEVGVKENRGITSALAWAKGFTAIHENAHKEGRDMLSLDTHNNRLGRIIIRDYFDPALSKDAYVSRILGASKKMIMSEQDFPISENILIYTK